MSNLLNTLNIDSQQRVIVCRNNDKEIIGIYETVSEAAEDFLIDQKEIFNAIDSKKPHIFSGFWSRELLIIAKSEKTYTIYEDLSFSSDRGKHKHPKASVAVVQLDYETMSLIARYKSMYDAFRITGARNISKCCKGEAQSSGGYKWMFESEYEALINENNEVDDLM